MRSSVRWDNERAYRPTYALVNLLPTRAVRFLWHRGLARAWDRSTIGDTFLVRCEDVLTDRGVIG